MGGKGCVRSSPCQSQPAERHVVPGPPETPDEARRRRPAVDEILARPRVGQVAVVWVQALSQWCQACDPLRRPVREWALVGPLTCEEGRPVVDALGP